MRAEGSTRLQFVCESNDAPEVLLVVDKGHGGHPQKGPRFKEVGHGGRFHESLHCGREQSLPYFVHPLGQRGFDASRGGFQQGPAIQERNASQCVRAETYQKSISNFKAHSLCKIDLAPMQVINCSLAFSRYLILSLHSLIFSIFQRRVFLSEDIIRHAGDGELLCVGL